MKIEKSPKRARTEAHSFDGARFIRVMCLFWGAIGVRLSIVSAFRASGNMLAAMVIALVAHFMLQTRDRLATTDRRLAANLFARSFARTSDRVIYLIGQRR